MKIQWLFTSVVCLIFSCQTKDNQSENSSNELPSYALEVLDSVTVHDILAQIFDYKIIPYPSQILNLEKYGDDLLISYKPTPANKDDIARVIAKEASKELRAELSKETKIRTVVLTQNGDIIPLALPEMNPYNFSVIGDDIWWMKKYVGEQEDFTVYRSRLVKNKVGYELGATHRIVASRFRINFFERSLQTKDTYSQSSI